LYRISRSEFRAPRRAGFVRDVFFGVIPVTRSARRWIVLALLLGLAAGCSRSEVKKVQVSGKVTFNGQPVPAGWISFQPDGSQGNPGREVRLVMIKDGVYDSSKEQDASGVYPGPTIIRIAGFDGKPQPFFHQGKQIFNPHEVRETVQGGTKDFDVPASAAKNLVITPTADN
jgi:hypothetical protein